MGCEMTRGEGVLRLCYNFFMKRKTIPKRLQAILWSADIKNLDLKRDRNYIIHQILQYGTLKDIKWLFDVYSKEKVRELFVTHPNRNYAKDDLYFISRFLLDPIHVPIDENDYVTSLFGPIRQRTAGSL